METFGAIFPSTVLYSLYMFQYDAFITLDFQKTLPACRKGYYHWYISILIQLRNLGTIYIGSNGVARKLGFRENSV